MGSPSEYRRLEQFGLRDLAESYKEEVRKRLAREQGGSKRDRADVRQQAEDAMWKLYLPAIQEREAAESESALVGCSGDLEQFLDPDYKETDPGKWLRDGLIWTAAEIRRVVIDSDEGTRVDLARAHTKPPTAWAVFCLEAFARKAPANRGDLIAKVMSFATRSHEPAPTQPDSSPENEYLAAL